MKRAHWRRVVRPHRQTFQRIAYCESGSNGRPRWHLAPHGGLGFMVATWRDFGGRGLPAHATKLEQLYRAVLVARRAGFGAWPVCRRAAGR